MISDATRSRLMAAIRNPKPYCSGAKRKQLQVTYDKLLDELSINILGEPCVNRMGFRKKINNHDDKSKMIESLRMMLMNQDLLFRKDYRDHSEEIIKFLTNDLSHFLEAVANE